MITQRPSPRFRSEEYFVYEVSEEMFYPDLKRFVWRRHAGIHSDGHQHGRRTSRETICYRVLLQKREFILRGTRKH